MNIYIYILDGTCRYTSAPMPISSPVNVQRRRAAVAATLACYWGRKCSAARWICSARISSFVTLQAKLRQRIMLAEQPGQMQAKVSRTGRAARTRVLAQKGSGMGKAVRTRDLS